MNAETQTLAQKLLLVQKKLKPLTKDEDNTFFKSKYADLSQVYELVKPELNALSILIAHSPGKDQFGAYMETSLIDTPTNQAMNARVYYSGAEENMQKVGAAGTYAKRQGLKALLAMEEVDDDGETAVGRGVHTRGNVDSKPNSGNTAGGGKVNVQPAGKAQGTPVQTEVSKSFNREAALKKVSLTSKVIIDSKRDTQDNVVKMLTAYGVKDKNELSDEQVSKLLKQLEEKLNAK